MCNEVITVIAPIVSSISKTDYSKLKINNVVYVNSFECRTKFTTNFFEKSNENI